MEIEPQRGGFRKPISVRAFILGYLAENGEAYIAEMHRAYKAELKRLAEASDKRTVMGKRGIIVRPYHAPRYHSFQTKVWELAKEGFLELTRAEPTTGLNNQFKGFTELPERHYYRVKT